MCHAILSARHVPTISHVIPATQPISDLVLSALVKMDILMQIRLSAKVTISNILECHHSCKTCTSLVACTSCKDLTFRNNYANMNQTCPCMSGFFDNGLEICESNLFSNL